MTEYHCYAQQPNNVFSERHSRHFNYRVRHEIGAEEACKTPTSPSLATAAHMGYSEQDSAVQQRQLVSIEVVGDADIFRAVTAGQGVQLSQCSSSSLLLESEVGHETSKVVKSWHSTGPLCKSCFGPACAHGIREQQNAC